MWKSHRAHWFNHVFEWLVPSILRLPAVLSDCCFAAFIFPQVLPPRGVITHIVQSCCSVVHINCFFSTLVNLNQTTPPPVGFQLVFAVRLFSDRKTAACDVLDELPALCPDDRSSVSAAQPCQSLQHRHKELFNCQIPACLRAASDWSLWHRSIECHYWERTG